MRSTRQLSITLPNEMADMVRAKVDSGAYASESEVIREGLRTLQDRDTALEKWLREDAVATYEAHLADPSRAIPMEEAFDRVTARIRARKTKAG